MHDVYREDPFMDTVFRLPQTFPRHPAIPTDATTLLAEFLKAEALVHQPETRREGAEKMAALLRSFNPGMLDDDRSNPKLDWYATKAAQAHALEGNLKEALECVELGLRHHPDDPLLLFLKRLLQDGAERSLRTAQVD